MVAGPAAATPGAPAAGPASASSATSSEARQRQSVTDLQRRYPKAQARDFDGDPTRLTEMDALVAYLQMLGTLVDFDSYVPEQNRR